METVKTEEDQLEKVLAVCQALDAEFRYSRKGRYFTAMVWNDWGLPCREQEALAIQREIQSKAGQFSGVVCYCFDAFSTLVYEV